MLTATNILIKLTIITAVVAGSGSADQSGDLTRGDRF